MNIHYLDPSINIQSYINQLDPTIPHTIYLSKGVYREKLKIALDHLTIIGEDPLNTILIYNDYSYKLHEDGLLYNTFRTSTLLITGNHVSLSNLTIQNDAGFGERIGQAIALSIYGNHTSIKQCFIKGYQDTLFIGPLPEDLTKRYAHILPEDERHCKMIQTYIIDSYIEGNIDFIFGSGCALFNQCTIVFNGSGYLAAPSTYKEHLGFVFYRCKIQSLGESYHLILARPWREFGKTYFIDCSMDAKIAHPRFESWDKKSFDFREYPHVESTLSKPLKPDEIAHILHHFSV